MQRESKINLFSLTNLYTLKNYFLAIASDSMQTLKTFTVVLCIYIFGITAAVATIKSSLDKSTAIQCQSGQVQSACDYLARSK